MPPLTLYLRSATSATLSSFGKSFTKILEWAFSVLRSFGNTKSSILIFYGSKSFIHLHTCTACCNTYIKFLWCFVLSESLWIESEFILDLISSTRSTIMWVTCLWTISSPFIARSVSDLLDFMSITISRSTLSTFDISIFLISYESTPTPVPRFDIPPPPPPEPSFPKAPLA